MSFLGALMNSNPVASAAQGGVTAIVDGLSSMIKLFKMPPEDAAKFQQQAQELVEKQFETVVANVNSARQMEIATKSKTPGLLSYFTLAAFVGCFAVIFSMKLDQNQMTVLATLIGMLGMMVKDVYGYWFGGSPSDGIQANMINDLQTKLMSLHSKALDQLGQNVDLPK